MEFCELKDSGKFNYCCPDGFYKLFYTNGYLEQTHYKIDTRIEGKITNYDTAGFKVNELIVENNIKNGIAKYFYSSGKVRSIEFYRNDTLIDIVIDFFESGDTAFKATILNGKINFPIKKCNKKGNCIIGRYTDDSHEKVEWTWRNPNNETTRKEILEPSDSGFVIPEI
jgi:antitoxin component YwqK of YwqJK toxin-antitoxin module